MKDKKTLAFDGKVLPASFVEKLKELPDSGDTTYVALTANAISGAREAYIEAGFSDYLSKPVESKLLEKMLLGYLPDEKVEEVFLR